MIYLLGASHLGAVLSAWLHEEETRQHQFGKVEPSFLSLRSKFKQDHNGIRAASIYIGHYSPWWGGVLAQQTHSQTVEISSGFTKMIESLDEDPESKSLYVFMNGEEHYHLGMMKHEPKMDFYIPSHPEWSLSPGHQVVPLETVENQMSICLNTAKLNFLVLRRLLPNTLIYNVVCPPPIHPINKTNKVGIAGEIKPYLNGDQIIRLKYYEVYTRLLCDFTSGLNISTIWPSEDTIGKDGYLNPKYAGDNVHGNAAYGQEVISQIRATLGAAT